MSPDTDLIRALARALGQSHAPPPSCLDERKAARLLLQVAFDRRCPRCRKTAFVVDGRNARCHGGHRFSLTRGTALQRTKVPLTSWLRAVWHLHVDTASISARAFSRRYRIRHATAWRLLHRVRAAFVHATPSLRGVVGKVACRRAARSNAHVLVARARRTTVVVDDVDLFPPTSVRGSPEAALFLGQLRSWLNATFFGVTDRYLTLYLAEFSARVGRASARA